MSDEEISATALAPNTQPTSSEMRRPGSIARNLAVPIEIKELQLCGVTVSAARPGEQVQVCTRWCVTSDDPFFHRIAPGLSSVIEHAAGQSGKGIVLSKHNSALVVIHHDQSAQLWLDSASTTLQCVVKRAMEAGMVVFQSDVADITGLSFPLVQIAPTDQVIYLFREGWRFGLFFDFNADGKLSLDNMTRDLGTLYRSLKYRSLYDTIDNPLVFGRLLDAGWFPFVEILGTEFQKLAELCESGFEIEELEKEILKSFTETRLDAMFARWQTKQHFSGKERILRSALNAFKSGDEVAVLKIVLTEIEGILGDAYRQENTQGAKLEKLIDFAAASAERKAGAPNTLFFPTAFRDYLLKNTFGKFDPVARTGKASSRHAVGHGAADADSYTMTRALQSLLTLDQLAFYT
jgi:hypothetical protein